MSYTRSSPLASTLVATLAAASLTACDGGYQDGAEQGGIPSAGAPIIIPEIPGVGLTAAYTPLYAAGTPVNEELQYTEYDATGKPKTLVTFMGARPTERHARERGEAWDAPDSGPGRYFTFPTFYFQNRTFGLEIRDEVAYGGKKIEVYLIVNDGTFRGTTFSLFRNINNPNVRDFGWSLNYGFNNPDGEPLCFAGVRNCRMDFNSNWRTSPHSPMKIGDKIELAPAPRLLSPALDGGGERYYSFEQLYVVGKGMRPWYGIVPNLDSEPLPDETLLGGQASVSYNYSEEPHRVFQQMANNIGPKDTKRFVQGRRLFHTSFGDGTHSEHPTSNPIFAEHKGQLGPRYNQSRCIECHVANGRSTAVGVGGRLATLSVLTGAAGANGAVLPDRTYGWNVQQVATSTSAANYGVKVASFDTRVRTLSEGEVVELSKPTYSFSGPVPSLYSVRQAPQVIGMGLLEAVDETAILALADPDDANRDGVRGTPHWVNDPETGKVHLGRFGWKATKASVRHQVGDALLKDMSITSPVFPSRGCQSGAADCRTTTAATHVSQDELNRLSDYLSLVGVPAQRSLRSGYPEGIRVSPEHDVNPTLIARGAAVFATAQCTSCHTAQLTTGNNHPFAELRNQTIRPYTDLLLHDMGPDLADTLPEGQATPNLWRTPPLWGIGSLKFVQGAAQNVRYLHDGRARTLTEAILWHGGEATNSRTRFEALSKAD
ncbi:MAG: di-heme oxidoredictase family protein, partial [Cystobacter sp.]